MYEKLISPQKVIYGFDILKDIGKTVKSVADKVVIVNDEAIYSVIKSGIDSIEKEEVEFERFSFNRECTYKEINLVVKKIEEIGAQAVIGIGGGKTSDTVKAAGNIAGITVITVPTIASNCASWASHSAIYNSEGRAVEYLPAKSNPNIIYIDEKIIFEAPVRYFKAGIADTLAKWVETKTYLENFKRDTLDLETEFAVYLAEKSYKELLEISSKAVNDVENGILSENVRRSIKHIIVTAGLIGGIGGNACCAVAAHSINNGLTVIPEKYKGTLHGESVGFGNIVQLVLNKESDGKINELVNFYQESGIKVSLADIGYKDITEEELRLIAEKTTLSHETIWNMRNKIDINEVKEAILKANNYFV